MYYLRTWPEPQAPPLQQTAGCNHLPPDTLQTPHQYYTVPLHHQQQPLHHSPYPANPILSHSYCNCIPLQSPTGGNDPYALHGRYGYSAYPYADAGTSAVAVGVAVDGVHGYGRDEPKTITARGATHQNGTHTVSYIPAPPNCFLTGLLPQQNTSNQPTSENVAKNIPQEISKVAQLTYCGVCKLDCNSQDILKSHKLGKKHKKNLQKLEDSIKRKPASSSKIAAHDGEDEPKEKKKKRKSTLPETDSELEMKKNRVLEAGASENEVRVCSICNIVTNSRKVYDDHLAGKRHAAMEKKLQEAVMD